MAESASSAKHLCSWNSGHRPPTPNAKQGNNEKHYTPRLDQTERFAMWKNSKNVSKTAGKSSKSSKILEHWINIAGTGSFSSPCDSPHEAHWRPDNLLVPCPRSAKGDLGYSVTSTFRSSDSALGAGSLYVTLHHGTRALWQLTWLALSTLQRLSQQRSCDAPLDHLNTYEP